MGNSVRQGERGAPPEEEPPLASGKAGQAFTRGSWEVPVQDVTPREHRLPFTFLISFSLILSN